MPALPTDADTLIDIGANLAHDSFDHDRAAVIGRAADAGVTRIVVTGSSRDSSLEALELARAHPGLFATCGLHPHHATDWNAGFAALIRDLAADPRVVSLGECGLDYFRDLSPRDAQRHALVAQLELAVQLRKPVFLHQRDAHADFLAILREFRPQLTDAVVHCFTDTAAALDEYLQLDCHIGITGWVCDERRGRDLYAAVAAIPDDRLLIESDAPYLLPRTLPKDRRPADGRRNEPCHLPWIVNTLSAARLQDRGHIAHVTRANAERFFRLPPA